MAVSFRSMLVAACLTAAFPAFAQESKPLNLSLRFGNFRPQFSDARRADAEWSSIGIESRWRNLGVSSSNPGQSSYLTLSLDSFGASDWRSTPILLNYVARSNELYFTGGAGFFLVEEPRESDGARFGFQIGAGWDFLTGKTPLFVEAKYFITTSNDHFNGFGIFLGVRL
jgi:hypothetical protein